MAHQEQLAEAATSLMELPDACLLAVLRCLADDPTSLCSAARAHSRLHQAAVVAFSSIKAKVRSQKRLYSSVLPYLFKHGQHVSSMQLNGAPNRGSPCWSLAASTIRLSHLAPMTQLSSLYVEQIALQLQPDGGFQGVIQAGLPLKQLRLSECQVEDAECLAAVLLLLPGLQHLSICHVYDMEDGNYLLFVTQALQELQQLTYLELNSMWLQLSGCPASHNSKADSSMLEPLRQLTQLADLGLYAVQACSIAADTLSGSCPLTRLDLPNVFVDPSVLTVKTLLQHLDLNCCRFPRAATGARVAQLLSALQQLTQLTHLNLAEIMTDVAAGSPPASAFSALTASSKLQYLDIGACGLPVDIWDHMFPAGRQLPHLQELWMLGAWPMDLYEVEDAAAVLGGSCLVSCCPGLQSLEIGDWQCSSELLAPLRHLTGLTGLFVSVPEESLEQVLGQICQLTGLRQLSLRASSTEWEEGLLLQLTQLRQLTDLQCSSDPWGKHLLECFDKVPGDEPVWRQVLQYHLDHSNRAVMQQAMAALANLTL